LFLGVKNFAHRIPMMDDENMIKICKLKIHQSELHCMCFGDGSIAIEILVLNFLVEVIMKHCLGSFYWNTL